MGFYLWMIFTLILAFPLNAFSQVKAELVVSGLTQPTDFQVAPGDTTRFFILEQDGRIRVIQNGMLQTTPFLDIDSLVGSGGSEQGLLGLAFHPNYATNRFFYVNYTNNSGDTVIARYTATSDGSSAQSGSAKTILTYDQPFSNHNGGQLVFGPDGFLYISVGDGGSAGDPQNNAQNLGNLLGKILRIDVDGGDPYAIPSTNPFVSRGTARGEIWAYGLRNPWRFSFDKETGDLYIGDVGQTTREEINAVLSTSTGGENYGWRIMEGTFCFNPSTNCDQTGLILPVHDYARTGGFCSVTGGFVYRGSAIPSVQGHYFYSDFCKGNLSSFRFSDGGASDFREWTESIGVTFSNVSSFGQDHDGELYVLSYSDGKVYKLVPDPSAVPSMSLTSSLILLASVSTVLGFRRAQLKNPWTN
jgi:glucose/arabinose dehydrogenase